MALFNDLIEYSTELLVILPHAKEFHDICTSAGPIVVDAF